MQAAAASSHAQQGALWQRQPTCSSVEMPGCQLGPAHVPNRLRHTLPHWYRLGLKRTWPPPVVRNCTCAGGQGLGVTTGAVSLLFHGAGAAGAPPLASGASE
jgi:hypothetical protein